MTTPISVRWAICGPGEVARRFAEAMTHVDDGEIVAVASRSLDRAKAFAERYDIPTSHASIDDLAADPQVDVVYVSTPPLRHLPDTLRLLEGGKHVLCEKPFALSADKAQRMAHAARTRGLFCMEAMWTRFLPAYRTLVALLQDGAIGEPLLVDAELGSRMDSPAPRLLDPLQGGGATRDLGIYPVQLCSLVLGTPDRVTAEGSVGPTGVDELVAAVLHHSRDRLGIVKASINADLRCAARISGTQGVIEIPRFMNAPQHLTVTRSGTSQRLDAPFGPGALRFEIEEVQRCLAEGSVESTFMPLDETVNIARTLDSINARFVSAMPITNDEKDATTCLPS